MTTIGFIGLGSMGQAIVGRLLEQGCDVSVWNRTESAGDSLVAAGASRLQSAEDAFASDIVVSILANDAAVSAVFTEEMLRLNPGRLHVNMASISLETAREIARRHESAGVHYLGAPVLGRPEVAAAGQLNILAGGSAEVITAAAPALDLIGKKTWHVSEEAAGASLVKIGVNYNIIHALGALGESINLVERGGIDPQLFVDILNAGLFGGAVYSGYGKLIAQREYFPAAFKVPLGLKDLTLAEQAAAELGAALPIAPPLHDLLTSAVADEQLTDGDWSIIAEVIRNR
jgi:3-hydroxyisobutyrate dehydrogenase-like beta-hydroxyacid dehydrogenase